jgi:hypothetical protein
MIFPGLSKINVTYRRQRQHQIRTFMRKNTWEPKDISVKPTLNTSTNFVRSVRTCLYSGNSSLALRLPWFVVVVYVALPVRRMPMIRHAAVLPA